MPGRNKCLTGAGPVMEGKDAPWGVCGCSADKEYVLAGHFAGAYMGMVQDKEFSLPVRKGHSEGVDRGVF